MSETFIWSRKTLRSKGLQTHEIFRSITHPLWSSYLHPSLFCRGEDAPALCLQAASPLWGENKRMKEGTMVWKFKGCCQTYYAIRHKVFSVKLCVVTQFMRNLSLHFNVKTWNCTCGIHSVNKNLPQAARQSIWRGSFSKIGTDSYASCILKQYRWFI